MTTDVEIIAKTTGGGTRETRDGTSARDGTRARSAHTRGVVVSAAIGAALLGAVAACGDASRRGAGSDTGGTLTVTSARRATVVGFPAETLSGDARLLALYPGTGPDSALIAFTFADSTRGVSAGLGVLDLRSPDGEREAHLAWPDSVGAVWWSGPHMLSFATTTGRGLTARVDMNADTLAVVLDSGRTVTATPASAPTPPRLPAAAIARATAFVDSAHQQPAGRAAPRSALRYLVDSLITAPSGRLVALHVIASDSSGRRRVNPAWYTLALPSGAVASVDSVVGPVDELPASTGAWGGADGSAFYYARRVAVYVVVVRGQ